MEIGRLARPIFMLVVAMLALTAGAPAPAAAASNGLPVAPLAVATARGVFRFKVEVADTDRTRERGLMFRKSLAADRGMLFDFKSPRQVAFWMKNTLIPLDMLFIGADGRIVSIANNAAPLSETPIASGGEVLGVLELRGGRAAEIGAAPGDQVRNRIFRP
ncbi:MAG: DUF192 domain-containing protein [Caulobacteraceae bacterium]